MHARDAHDRGVARHLRQASALGSRLLEKGGREAGARVSGRSRLLDRKRRWLAVRGDVLDAGNTGPSVGRSVGLERSCELATIARLHDRDWYYEGGLQLLSQQQGNGSFRAEHPSSLLLDTTCFAVLFLAKSTVVAPVTGR